MVQFDRHRLEHGGHGSADQAIAELGGQVFMRHNSHNAVREFRPCFDSESVYGQPVDFADLLE